MKTPSSIDEAASGNEHVFNPFFKLGFTSEDEPTATTRIRVASLRRSLGWQSTEVTPDEHPLLFSLLHRMLTSEGDVELELGDEERAALRSIGLWVSPDELPARVGFQLPSIDAPRTPSLHPSNDDEPPNWIVHPSLSPLAPAHVEVPTLVSDAGTAVWLTDGRTGVAAPYAGGALDASLRACVPGQPPRLEAEACAALRGAGLLLTPDELGQQKAARDAELALAARTFAASKFAIVPRLIDAASLAALQRYYRALVADGWLRFGDAQVDRRHVQHNEPIARLFLTSLRDLMQAVVGVPIKPSYAYFACYREGSILTSHIDRAQCEFSISFLVDYEPTPDDKAPWPLWVCEREEDETIPLYQRIGDGIVYRGRQLYHSRTALHAGHRSTHIFFHYVPSDFAGSLD
jgi:hypothetical protein